MVETRRQQIEEAASELFRERGYAATSVRDIAQALTCRAAACTPTWRPRRTSCGRSSSARRIGSTPGRRLAAGEPRTVRGPLADGPRPRRIVTGERRTPPSSCRVALPRRAQRAEIAARRDAYEAVLRGADRRGAGRLVAGPTAPPSGLTGRAILSALNGIATWYSPDRRARHGSRSQMVLAFSCATTTPQAPTTGAQP